MRHHQSHLSCFQLKGISRVQFKLGGLLLSLFIGLTSLFGSLFISTWGFASEYQVEFEKLIPLRSNGKLQILNNRGDVIIEGWSQDKVRLSLKKKATAENELEAQRLFKSVEVFHQVIQGNVEISANFGQGLTLQEKLHERDHPKTSMQMSLLAPAGRSLQILALQGRVILKNWYGPVEIRASSGEIRVENVRGREIFVLCPSCSIEAKGIRGDLRCIGGKQDIQLENVKSDQVYIESDSGKIRAKQIQGEQLYVSKTGAVLARNLSGNIEFMSRDANVELTHVSGSVSGKTTSGNILIRSAQWIFHDKALLESESGNIAVALPDQFSGELDLLTQADKLRVDVPVSWTIPISNFNSAMLLQHFVGTVRGGHEPLRIVSEKGNVEVTYWK